MEWRGVIVSRLTVVYGKVDMFGRSHSEKGVVAEVCGLTVVYGRVYVNGRSLSGIHQKGLCSYQTSA